MRKPANTITRCGESPAARKAALAVAQGETYGLVGESGSGKSVTAYSILRILVDPGKITAGKIIYAGEDIVQYSPHQ